MKGVYLSLSCMLLFGVQSLLFGLEYNNYYYYTTGGFDVSDYSNFAVARQVDLREDPRRKKRKEERMRKKEALCRARCEERERGRV